MQKLIWREVCWTNSLPSTVLYQKAIVKYSKGLIWVITQHFVMMSSLNVKRNLHKAIYTNSRNIAPRQTTFVLNQPKILSDYLQSSPQSRYMFDIKKLLLLIDALNFIPGEARDLLRIAPRIVIDLLEGRLYLKTSSKSNIGWTDSQLFRINRQSVRTNRQSVWTNRQSGDDSELPAKKKTFETNTLKFFFSRGHLLLIFVVLQIKIITLYLSMSRTIDRVFYNPVENSSHGHPPYPLEISTLQPPPPPPTPQEFPFNIRGWGVGGYGYFLESHIMKKDASI